MANVNNMLFIIRKLLIFIILQASNALIAQSKDGFSLELDSFRTSYINEFLINANSPLDSIGVKYLDFYLPNPDYKVVGNFVLNDKPKSFEMPTYAGTTKSFIEYGRINFSLTEKDYVLPIYKNLALQSNPVYKDHLFLPFNDYTNGNETYGGGRYIDIKIQDIKENKIVIDFNKAYNPYCAYKDGYRCPVPPKANQLNTYIKAGEKNYLKHH